MNALSSKRTWMSRVRSAGICGSCTCIHAVWHSKGKNYKLKSFEAPIPPRTNPSPCYNHLTVKKFVGCWYLSSNSDFQEIATEFFPSNNPGGLRQKLEGVCERFFGMTFAMQSCPEFPNKFADIPFSGFSPFTLCCLPPFSCFFPSLILHLYSSPHAL